MERYAVLLTARAIRDLDKACDYIRQFAPETVEQWRLKILNALKKLEINPDARPIAPESHKFDYTLREFFIRTKSRFATRALFTIVSQEVRILAIRRPGQTLVKRRDLK